MEHSGVTKFTRLLPLSIRKNSGIGNQFHQSLGANGSGDRQFCRDNGNGVSDFFSSDPFESSNESRSPPSTGSSEQKEVVRVTLTYPSPAVGALNPHKEISLRLTNDENPTFFYHLRITESDYPAIKNQQGLLVDFYGFPNQLITLLEKCDPTAVSDSEDGRNSITTGPKFIMVMKVGMNSVLDIVESNPFKYLCHLSLQINPGTDSEIKKYLADVTSHMKKEKILLEEKFSHMSSASEREILNLKKIVSQKEEELKQLREELHSQASSLSSKHFEDMTIEKEKLLKMQGDLASKYERERQEIDRRQSQTVATLESRIMSLETENRDLIQTKFKHETALQNFQAKIKNSEGDLRLLQQELTAARKLNEKLDRDYHEKQKTVNSSQNRLTVLEADLKEKQNTLQRQQDFIAQLSEQKKFLEDHATNMVREVEKLKNVNKSTSSELMKANDIIRKLQDDIRSLHTKTKMQNQIAHEQERRLADQEKNITQLEETISKLTSTISSVEEVGTRAKEDLQEAMAKVEAMENTIKSNENMISWLNKQLNEFQGLGKLNKFRQNLTATTQGPLNTTGVQQGRSGFQEASGHINSSTLAVQGSLRDRLFSSNVQNTIPNDSPSWMNIYQSTSTPLDNDITSRFERITATNNNYSLGRSRLEGISERNGDHILDDNGPGEENRNPSVGTGTGVPAKKATGASTKPANTRPPSWTKPRSGKVTLEVAAPTKTNQVWRNN